MLGLTIKKACKTLLISDNSLKHKAIVVFFGGFNEETDSSYNRNIVCGTVTVRFGGRHIPSGLFCE